MNLVISCSKCKAEFVSDDLAYGWDIGKPVYRIHGECPTCLAASRTGHAQLNRALGRELTDKERADLDADVERGRSAARRTLPMTTFGIAGEANVAVGMPGKKRQIAGVCDGCEVSNAAAARPRTCRECRGIYYSCERCNVKQKCVDCAGKAGVNALLQGIEDGLNGVGPEPTAREAAELAQWAAEEGVEVRMWHRKRPLDG